MAHKDVDQIANVAELVKFNIEALQKSIYDRYGRC